MCVLCSNPCGVKACSVTLVSPHPPPHPTPIPHGLMMSRFECLFGFATRPGAEAVLLSSARNSVFTSVLLGRGRERGHVDSFGDLMKHAWDEAVAATSRLEGRSSMKPCFTASTGACCKRLVEAGAHLTLGPSGATVEGIVEPLHKAFQAQVSVAPSRGCPWPVANALVLLCVAGGRCLTCTSLLHRAGRDGGCAPWNLCVGVGKAV